MGEGLLLGEVWAWQMCPTEAVGPLTEVGRYRRQVGAAAGWVLGSWPISVDPVAQTLDLANGL